MSGIFLTGGSQVSIPSFTINVEDIEATKVVLHVGIDVYPMWLKNAIIQTRFAEAAASKVDAGWSQGDGEVRVRLIEDELVSAMGAIVAAAAALDAFYGSVRDRTTSAGPKPSARKKRARGRDRIMIAMFQQRFALKNVTVEGIKPTLRDILRFRHLALHAHGRAEPAALHPRLNQAMAQQLSIFRAENARQATIFALTLIAWLVKRPHRRYAGLAEHCVYAREQLSKLIEDWQSDHEQLAIPEAFPDNEKSRAKSKKAES